ncbi:hypothetical protein X943_003007 [Babesia divergens]|uniref:Uncharacterized protein n=1 Tax=Babesia divergens TaxID=32595 RepID=A0AAD9GJW3_BABDI|nr:hypothetical protein X943_003007 [Babesia divergens]
MAFTSNIVSLEELECAVIKSYPGIDQQLSTTFTKHDIAGDGVLPYSVVEPLLRHFLVTCGLGDYMDDITDPDGRLMNERLAPYLGGTSLEGIASFGDDRMLTSQEMSTMAIVWLKIISESYPKDDVSTSSLGVSSMLCCGAVNYVSDENEMIESSGNDSEVQASLNAGEELLETPVYAERVIDDLEEEEIRQKNMENYIQTLVNETTMNRNKGVKCYVYSAATTANGTCVSAGAAVPQRRPRPRENKKPAAGCC